MCAGVVAAGWSAVEVVLHVVSVVAAAPGEGTTVRVVTATVSPGVGLLVRVVALGVGAVGAVGAVGSGVDPVVDAPAGGADVVGAGVDVAAVEGAGIAAAEVV